MPSHQSNSELRRSGLASEVYLRIDAARKYGFIAGGPEINVERCEEVAAEAAAAGHEYTEAEIAEASRWMIAWHNASPSERAFALGRSLTILNKRPGRRANAPGPGTGNRGPHAPQA